MFTKPSHSRFFNLGQVIETHRGKGIFQPAVDEAIKLLQAGEWVRLEFWSVYGLSGVSCTDKRC